MYSGQPKLYIQPPSGMNCEVQDIIIPPEKEYLTVGRHPNNDIIIPDGTITREQHCTIKRETNRWFVIANPQSANGTFLQKTLNPRELVRINGELPLYNEYIILLPSSHLLSNNNSTDFYWKLIFKDPSGQQDTLPIPQLQGINFTYSITQKRLSCSYSGLDTDIYLTPQQLYLIHYMAEKNQKNNQPLLCTYEELTNTLNEHSATNKKKTGKPGQNPTTYEDTEVIRIVYAINSRIEKTLKQQGYDPKTESFLFLENRTKSGYILRAKLT